MHSVHSSRYKYSFHSVHSHSLSLSRLSLSPSSLSLSSLSSSPSLPLSPPPLSIALDPLYPSRGSWETFGYASGGGFCGEVEGLTPLGLSGQLNTLGCSVSFHQGESVSMVKLIEQVRTHTRTYTHTHTHTHAQVHKHTHIRSGTHTHTHIQVNAHKLNT